MILNLIEKHQEVEGVTSFIFQPEKPVTWTAGQYLSLLIPHENPDNKGIQRYFTISSAPFDKNIQITTRISGSSFKKALDALPLGGEVEAENIEGDFTLTDPSGEYVFIAGGIGITPIRSILRQLNHEGRNIAATLIYGNRDDNPVFKNELEELVKHNPRFKVHYLISPEKINEETIRKYSPDLEHSRFYISGPEPMVEALESVFLNDLQIADERTKRDYFPGYTELNF